MTDRVTFTCNGRVTEVDVEPGESLLSVLRERLGIVSVKDGCAPQGQCGCCTVLVDGDARVACVTAAARSRAGRSRPSRASTPTVRDASRVGVRRHRRIAVRVLHARASSCAAAGRDARPATSTRRSPPTSAGAPVGGRCTTRSTRRHGSACRRRDLAPRPRRADARRRRRTSASSRTCRSAVAGSPTTPRRATRSSRCRCRPGSDADVVEAVGLRWVVGESLVEARAAAAGKVQGRRTTVDVAPPLPLPPLPDGGVRLATSWVEPAYLEPDASWCEPGGEPASPLANGGAFGGKEHLASRPTPRASSPTRFGRTVRVVYSREDVVRLGPKRPPIAATAVWRDGARRDRRRRARACRVRRRRWPSCRTACDDRQRAGSAVDVAGPAGRRGAARVRARGAGSARRRRARRGRRRPLDADATTRALLDTLVVAPSGARAGARVTFRRAPDALAGVEVRVAAGDPLDEIVLRSYALGAAHMALGWVLTESIAVDPETGEVHDLTIRSFGIIRARGHAAGRRSRSSTTPGPPRARRPTRCSPRSPRRPGTRSPASKASGPIRSPRTTPARPRLLRR